MNDDIEKTLELLREAHREPIAEAHYAAVRARVLSQLAVRRQSWLWAYAFAAVAVVAIMFWLGHTPVGQALPPANRTLAQAAPAAAPQVEQAAPVHRSVGRRKRLPHAVPVIGPPVAQPLVVKLVTNDPNIVIYWISGE